MQFLAKNKIIIIISLMIIIPILMFLYFKKAVQPVQIISSPNTANIILTEEFISQNTAIISSDGQIFQSESSQSEIIGMEEINNFELVDKHQFIYGDTIIGILKSRGFELSEAIALSNAINPIIPVKLIQIGDLIEIYRSEKDKSYKIILITKSARVAVVKEKGSYKADLISKPTNLNYVFREFLIDDNFYDSSIRNGIPESILNKAIKLHSKNINFSRDIRIGTKSKLYFTDNQSFKKGENGKFELLYSSLYNPIINEEFFLFETADEKKDYYDTNGIGAGGMKIITPLRKLVETSKYGMRIHPVSGEEKMHYGIDYAAKLNEPIFAIADGVVDFIGDKGDFGKYIRLSHANNVKSAYAHLNKFSENLVKGSLVNQSDIIGFTGRTGLSTGTHLHFEIIVNEKRINPNKFDEEISNYYLDQQELMNFFIFRNKVLEDIEQL
ncbi:MAG: M23 family metallopeptidase [Hyphomicrobiales bacterium]|nr:MAG: M23 family metallopeptidase [Hyphomicrobiales bacterium]